jgi:hypothetical protein
MIEDKTFETEIIPPRSGHHVEEAITTIVEILAYYIYPPFTNPLGQPLIDPPSTRYVDGYSSYYLPPNSTTTQSFGFLEGLENSSFSTTPVVGTTSDSSLPKKSMT